MRKTVVVGLLLAAVLASTLVALRTPSGTAPERRDLNLNGVTLVNPGEERRRVNVLVREGRIASIAEASSATDSEYHDRFVLPGLIDMHVHLPPGLLAGQRDLFLTLFLAHGVTTLRDVGAIGWGDSGLRSRISSGELAGPRIFSCGPMLDGEAPSWPLARIVRDAAEALLVVDELAARGVDCIKTFPGVSNAALDGIREAADRHGLPVVGHLPGRAPWGEHRIDDVQHVCDPHCWSMGPSSQKSLVGSAERFGLAHTPTLVVYAAQLEMYEEVALAGHRDLAWMPRFWREILWDPRRGLGFAYPASGRLEDRRPGHERMVAGVRETVRLLHERGVRLYAGSDPLNPRVVPGASLHRELALLVEAGLSLEAAWKAATVHPGEALSAIRGPRLGRVVPGAAADLLILRSDPTRDLGALGSLEAVVAAGRLYRRAELDEILERQRKHFEGALYDWLSVHAARLLADRIGERPDG